MDYEKAYKEALERAKKRFNVNPTDGYVGYSNEILKEIFPELKESNDEKIGKSIIKLIQLGGYMSPADKTEAIAYLEQQKPAEWNEEEKLHLANAILAAEKEWGIDSCTANFLKSLRFQPISQPNTNHIIWHNASEEKPTKLPIIHIWYHGNRINAVIAHENIGLQAELDDINFQPDDKWAYVEDLLNAQPYWKPSEKQMQALNFVLAGANINHYIDILFSLRNELQKL